RDGRGGGRPGTRLPNDEKNGNGQENGGRRDQSVETDSLASLDFRFGRREGRGEDPGAGLWRRRSLGRGLRGGRRGGRRSAPGGGRLGRKRHANLTSRPIGPGGRGRGRRRRRRRSGSRRFASQSFPPRGVLRFQVTNVDGEIGARGGRLVGPQQRLQIPKEVRGAGIASVGLPSESLQHNFVQGRRHIRVQCRGRDDVAAAHLL